MNMALIDILMAEIQVTRLGAWRLSAGIGSYASSKAPPCEIYKCMHVIHRLHVRHVGMHQMCGNYIL